MSDIFQHLSEQILNRTTAVRPLHVSRFSLLSDRNLSLPVGLRQPVGAPQANEHGENLPWVAKRLPNSLVAAEGHLLDSPIPSLRQMGRMTTRDAETAHTRPQRLIAGSLDAPEAGVKAITETLPTELMTNQATDVSITTPKVAATGNQIATPSAIGDLNAPKRAPDLVGKPAITSRAAPQPAMIAQAVRSIAEPF